MTGMPIVNEACFVLWRKINMPAIEPILPPRTAVRKRVFSGILHFLRFALDLSIPIRRKPVKFIRIKYRIVKYFIYGIIFPFM
jgi:hypothetical protein